MNQIFTTEFFTSNRRRLQNITKARLIVLSANGLLQRSADTTFRFRQDSNFWYLTNLNEPDYILVITPDEEFLIAPKRSDHRDLWDGSVNEKAIKTNSGISSILENHKGWTKLDLLIKKHKKVHTITPAEEYLEHFGFYTNPARSHLLNAINKHRKIDLVDIRKILAGMRQIKQAPEIKAIQSAIDITSNTLETVKKRINKYKSEYEVAADITHSFMKLGNSDHAYIPIVASGGHAATIHYIDNDGPIEQGSLILLDVGAEVSNYSADITRTYAVGEVSKRHKDIYDSVLDVRQSAMKLLKPGIKMKDFEASVDGVMAKELKKLRLIDDVKDKKQLKKYYPHLTSHFLGLDTHDAADYYRPLEPGMVLTVEPGIYIPEENIGIRIEDDVIITENGVKVLSDSLPVSLY